MEKGIKAYHSYLSFGDAKEALSETVCEDLNLDDLCEQLDYTSSCVGRQYLYHILCTDKISDVTGLCKLNCVMLYSHSISSVGERPAPRGGTTRPDECKITTI